MLNEVLNQILQIKKHRATIHQGDVIHYKRGLQLRILEKRIQHDICRSITLNLDSDTGTAAVTLVVDV